MSLSWGAYTAAYYAIQIGSLFVIWFFVTFIIPSDLMDWIINGIFSLEDVEQNNQNLQTPPVRCTCNDLWNGCDKFFQTLCKRKSHSADNLDSSGNIDLADNSDSTGNIDSTDNSNSTGNIDSTGNLNSNDNRCCVSKIYYKHCTGAYGLDDSKDKKMRHDFLLKLKKQDARLYCGCINYNLNRFGVYLLLCACVWCASIAFFEGVILAYAVVPTGENCPTPKRGADTTVMHCFIYQNSYDGAPTNRTFPFLCNRTTTLPSSGSWAGCYAWIYADVEVVDVVEELGICTGIITFIGSTVTIITYLCRSHRWRLFFDILCCLAIATIPTLRYTNGSAPFLTYILLASLSISIIITEYLLGYVPLLTWFYRRKKLFRCCKTC